MGQILKNIYLKKVIIRKKAENYEIKRKIISKKVKIMR